MTVSGRCRPKLGFVSIVTRKSIRAVTSRLRSICFHARDGTDAILVELADHDGEVLLSALSLAELQWGIFGYRGESRKNNRR